MAPMRTYGDGCAIAQALDLVGERWALLIVRELLLGPKRYTDLRRGLPNASPNVLSQRLVELERAGIVDRRTLPPPAASRVYQLTGWGRQLEGIVVALGHWAARSPTGLVPGPVGADSMIIAMRSRFDPAATGDSDLRVVLRFGDDAFTIAAASGEIAIARGSVDDADATIVTDPDTLGSMLWGGGSVDDAVAAGRWEVTGDADAVERLLRAFPMPAAAA